MTKDFTTKSTPLTIRLPNKLIGEIDEMRKDFDEDRATWIRKALIIAMDVLDKEADDDTIEDYVFGRIDKNEFKDDMGFDVPMDIEETRQSYLKKLLQKKITTKKFRQGD